MESDEKSMKSTAEQQQHPDAMSDSLPEIPNDIPLPVEDENPAWKKAQEALRSIGAQSKPAAQPQEPAQQDASAYYGWPPASAYQAPGYNQYMHMNHHHMYHQQQQQPENPFPPMQQRSVPQPPIASASNVNLLRPMPLAQVNLQAMPHVQAGLPGTRPFGKAPIRFSIGQQPPQQPATHEQLQTQKFLETTGGPRMYPATLKDYIERAYRAIEGDEERQKLEQYLKLRVEPLLKSGAIYAVNWSAEPLPHELNFLLKTSWTPSSTLKGAIAGTTSRSSTDSGGRWRRGESPAVASQQMGKSPSSSSSSSALSRQLPFTPPQAVQAQNWPFSSSPLPSSVRPGPAPPTYSPPPSKRSRSRQAEGESGSSPFKQQQQQQQESVGSMFSTGGGAKSPQSDSSSVEFVSPANSQGDQQQQQQREREDQAVQQQQHPGGRWGWIEQQEQRVAQQLAQKTLSKKERKRLRKQQKSLAQQAEQYQKIQAVNARLDFSTGGPFPSFTPLGSRVTMGGAGEGQQQQNPKWQIDVPTERKMERARRFADDGQQQQRHRGGPPIGLGIQQRRTLQSLSPIIGGEIGPNFAQLNIVGTCTDIEKSFFRLTTAPDPSQVRPFQVLTQSLENVKRKYKDSRDYRYASDQLKSIRQDLMIQNIRSAFTVSVYETNARVALENKDREEFNQCQNQLKQLYKAVPGCPNRWEFSGYRLLYYVYMRATLDVASLLDELVPDAIADECMGFGLTVWDAWSMGNYIKLFRLYAKAPKMAGYVMDFFIDRERGDFLLAVLKAFRPDIGLDVLAGWLQMEGGEKALVDFLAQRGIEVEPNGTLDCRKYANHKI